MKRNILFVCSFNAGRSIIAESLLNTLAGDHFVGYSAGEAPRAAVHPDVMALLRVKGHDVSGLRPKPWEDFVRDDSPRIDLAITLCNNAEGEMCMELSSRFPVAHWDIPDPAQASGDRERAMMFEQAFTILQQEIEALVELPETFEGDRFVRAVNRIGYSSAA